MENFYSVVTGDGGELLSGFCGTLEQAREAARRQANETGNPVYLTGPGIDTDPDDDDEDIGEEVLPDALSYVVLVGNPIDGFSVVGPFVSREEAENFCQGSEETWWIAKMERPN